jgi:hypothetical protein
LRCVDFSIVGAAAFSALGAMTLAADTERSRTALLPRRKGALLALGWVSSDFLLSFRVVKIVCYGGFYAGYFNKIKRLFFIY